MLHGLLRVSKERKGVPYNGKGRRLCVTIGVGRHICGKAYVTDHRNRPCSSHLDQHRIWSSDRIVLQGEGEYRQDRHQGSPSNWHRVRHRRNLNNR